MGLRLAVNLYGKPIPQNPSYTGDIPQYDNIKAISIKEAEQKITWIKPYGLNLLVADRVLMANASWEDLQRSGLDKGIPILVGGQRFLCRITQVGKSIKPVGLLRPANGQMAKAQSGIFLMVFALFLNLWVRIWPPINTNWMEWTSG